MEKKTNNKQRSGITKEIVIALVLIIVVLLGFIVCDKFIQKNPKPKSGNNTQEKECNCPKCDESENIGSYIIESATGIKEINVTDTNKIFKIVNKAVLLRKDNSDYLYVNNQTVKSTVDGSEVIFIKAYLTEKYIFFTDIGNVGESIVYAINEDGKEVAIKDNKYQLSDFKVENGNLYATGYIFCGIDCPAKDKKLIIKYNNNTLTVVPVK